MMVDIIFDYQGVLDKYIGDGMLAVFGAPFSTGKDADRAVKTAIDMLAALEALNCKRFAKAQEPLNIGVGISTDTILSGNIGSLKRMDYTVIGDGVNLASRLEGANKVYGTHILVSEFTYKKLQDAYISREIDVICVKGKTKPISVYQVLAESEYNVFPSVAHVLALFREGLLFYRNREWDKGMKCFPRVLESHPHDTVSRLYLDRCHYFTQNPPAEGWDYVWTLTSK